MLTRAALSAAVTSLALCTACARPESRAPAVQLASTLEPTIEPELASPSAPHVARGYPVLAARGRLFVLLGEHTSRPSSASDRWLLAGGWALELGDAGPAPELELTVIGPAGRCTGRASRSLSLTLDVGGYAAGSLPLETERALELEGCSALAAEPGPLVALPHGEATTADARHRATESRDCEVRAVEDAYCLLKR